jgi:hypothetical protein
MLPRPDAPPRFSVLDDWPSRWRAAVHLCQSAAATPFSPWERQFLATIARYRHQPSSVQLDILASITARQLAGEGGA